MRADVVEYGYVRLKGDPDDAYAWLHELAEADVDLHAFSAIPFGPDHVELTLFPSDPSIVRTLAARRGATYLGPYRAILVQGDDRLGALATLHEALRAAGVRVYASSGVTDGRGGFGYVVYVREADAEAAKDAVRTVGT
jgi:hypothetical protein